MASQPKKQDFWNRGKGPNAEVEYDTPESPSLSPAAEPNIPPPITFGASTSPRLLDFPPSLSGSSSPPAVYPHPAPYNLYASPYPQHNPYLTPQLCPSTSTGTYPLPGMPYSNLDLNSAVQGAVGIAPNTFTETHMARSYASPIVYPPESWGMSTGERAPIGRSREGAEMPHNDRESSHSGTRQQKCSLCFNHGIVVDKKGHKSKCKFQACECNRCTITKKRQETMREQQKLTRNLRKMQLSS